MAKSSAFLMQRQGSGWTCIQQLQSTDRFTSNVSSMSSVPEFVPQSWTSLKATLLQNEHLITFVYESNITAPSKIYQIVFQCLNPAQKTRVRAHLDIGSTQFLTGVRYLNHAWVDDIPESFYDRMSEI